MGEAYHEGIGGTPKDDIHAYMWTSLAVAQSKDDIH